MAGLNGDTNAQYIVVSSNGNGQKDWGPQVGETESRAMLVFFDAAGNEQGTFKFPSDPPNGANTVLIATAAFTNRTGLRADFVIPPLLSPGAGKVCFKGNPANQRRFEVNLCLSYGNFPPGLTEGAGSPAPALPVSGEPTALVRFQNFFFFEFNRNADFRLGGPHPTNTAGQTASFLLPGPRIAAEPGSIELPPAPFPATSVLQRTIALRNVGTLNPLTITSLAIQTNVQNDFTVIGDTGEGTVAPGGTRILTLGFLPRGPGLRRATLRVESNDPEQPSLLIPLSARAVNLDPCAAPDTSGAFAQNSCSDAMLVGPGIVYTGNNAGATLDGTSPCNSPPFNVPDVWFKYVSGLNGNLNVSFSGSDSNTIISFHRACTGNSNAIFCAGPIFGQGQLPPFNIFMTNSQMLLVRVSSRTGLVANFRMTLTGPPAFDFDANKNGRNDACEFDFGDALGAGFPTLTASNGARHRINNNLFLGRFRDADPDGQPGSTAQGDNVDGERNDEDGVTALSPLVPGSACALAISATGSGFLSSWVDFNRDGDWNDPGERVFNNILLGRGENNRSFLIPSDAAAGDTVARFRFSSTGINGPEGLAEDGEVEDYAYEILSTNPMPASLKVRFNEVMAGLNGDSAAQFIELQVFDESHKAGWAGNGMLLFFDALGRQTGRFVFPSNPPAGGDTVLIASHKLAHLRPDFIMTPELNAISGKVVFRRGAETIALAYGGNGYYGRTDGAGPANTNEVPILGAKSLSRASEVAFGLNQNVAFTLAPATPRNTAGETATLTEDNIVKQGERVFAFETFNGNGRTCQTCHQPGRDQFGLTVETIASMPADDPLFVFEKNVNVLHLTTPSSPGDLRGPIFGSSGSARVLAGSEATYFIVGGSNLTGAISDTNGNSGVFASFQVGDLSGPNPRNGSPLGLEDSAHLRSRALVLENIDGFTQREVMRISPHLLNLELTAPYGLSGEFTNLRDFSDGAVVQHFSRSLERVPDRDFRHPTLAELEAMEAFQNSIRQPADEDFTLSRFVTTEAQKRGRNLFFSDESKCSKCHSGSALAHADGSLTGTVAGRNENFDTGIANQQTNIVGAGALPTEPAGLIPGQSTRKFNTPPLFGIRLTPPFFHDGSAATLTEAVKFYDSSIFVASTAGDLVGAVPAANQPDKIADIVAFLESLVELPVNFTRVLNFGVACSTGQPPAALSASVTNIGTSAIAITAVQIAGTNAAEFQIISDSGETNLAPGAVRRVEVTFAAGAVGLRSATLEFKGQVPDVPGEVSFGVALEGALTEAIAHVSRSNLVFAPREIGGGSAENQFIMITNRGPGELIVRNITTLVSNAAFQISLPGPIGAPPPQLPIVLPTNGFAAILVQFTPSTRGLKTALVKVDLVACNLQSIELPISGLATSRVDHFKFDPIFSFQPLNDPFPIAITARDRNDEIVTDYSGEIHLSAHSLNSTNPAVLITEIDPGNPDRVEISNLAGKQVNVAGWQVLLYDSFPSPKTIFNLPAVTLFTNGGLTITEGGSFPGSFPNFFTGTNLTWIGGSDQIAVMLLDDQQNVIDFVTTSARTNITQPRTVPADHWNGPGVSLMVEDGVSSYQRVGTMNHNNATDWTNAPITIGSRNTGLITFGSAPFGSIPISRESVVLTAGAWSGEIAVLKEAGHLRLAAADLNELAGVSALFSVLGSPPMIENLPISISTDEDVPPPLITFRIWDAETPVDQLRLAAGSIQTNFIPSTNMVLGGTGEVRTLQIHLPTNLFGSGTIFVAATDGANTILRQFDMTIHPVNDLPRVIFSGLREDFDSVLAPGLPPGWTGSGFWQTANSNAHSPPNAAFVPDPSFTSDSRLESPEFFVLTTNAQVTFQHFFNTEPCCDNAALELSQAGGPFGTPSANSFIRGAPNTGQGTWRGFGTFTTTLRLPDSAVGKLNRLRWRFTSNATNGFPGWWVDSIVLAEAQPLAPAIDEDTILIAAFTVEDPDQGSAPTVSVAWSNPGLFPPGSVELTGSGFGRAIIARPLTNAFGASDFSLTVSDEAGPMTVTVPVQVRPINDPPIVSAVSNHTVIAGTLVEQQITGFDPDGTNTVRYTIAQAPIGASVNQTNGLFTWRPSASHLGSNVVRIQVTENVIPSVSTSVSFGIMVLPMPLASSPLAFGTQCLAGASAIHRTVLITNRSASAVRLSNISISGSNAVDFALHEHPGEVRPELLGPGEFMPVDLIFTSQSPGLRQAVLEVAATAESLTAPFVFQVNLSGLVVDRAVEISPSQLVFGEQEIRTTNTAPRSVTIRNIGQSPLRISETRVLTNLLDFGVPLVTSLVLTNGQTHTLLVQFVPRNRGSKDTILRITTDACVSNRWEIPISATATSSLHHFNFDPVAQQAFDTPFPVRITAQDINNDTVPEFSGPALLYTANRSPVVITEVNPGTLDQVEFMNVLFDPVDISGWQIVLYDPPPIVKSVFTIPAASMLTNLGIFTLREGGTAPGALPAFFTGGTLDWSGANPAFAILLRNATGEIMDFYSSTSATHIVDPVAIPPQEWSGRGFGPSLSDNLLTYQRVGSIDHNVAVDWILATPSMGVLNLMLSPVFDLVPERSISNIVAFTDGVAAATFAIAAEQRDVKLIAVDAEGRLGVAIFSVVGDPPVLAGLPATLDLLEDSPLQIIPFQLADAETPLGKLFLNVRTTNTNLITGLSLLGTNPDRVLRFNTASNRFGNATIIFEAFDGMHGITSNVLVTVRPVNDPPEVILLTQAAMFEDFDSLMPPALPAGWAATSSVPTVNWRTISGQSDLGPNSVFVPNLSTASDISLTSPSFAVGSSPPIVSFRHQFNTEACCDHARLELAIGTNAFVNVTSLGGTFSSGAYNTFASWSGFSGAFITSTIRLPAPTTGQTVRLRWRFTTDTSIGGAGWWLDTISVTNILSPGVAIIRLNEDTPSAAQFTLADVESGGDDLQLRAISSNPLLIAPEDILFSGFGSNRLVTVTPLTNAFGTGTVQIVASDGLATSAAEMIFDYIPVNDLPILPSISNVTVHAMTPLAIAFQGFDPDNTPVNYQLLPLPLPPGVSLVGGTFRWTPDPTQLGTHSFTARANDSQAPGFDEESFAITVVPGLALGAARLSETGAGVLTWNAFVGGHYRIEYTSDLASTNWNDLAEITATFTPVTFIDPLPLAPQRFYRILFVQP